MPLRTGTGLEARKIRPGEQLRNQIEHFGNDYDYDSNATTKNNNNVGRLQGIDHVNSPSRSGKYASQRSASNRPRNVETQSHSLHYRVDSPDVNMPCYGAPESPNINDRRVRFDSEEINVVSRRPVGSVPNARGSTRHPMESCDYDGAGSPMTSPTRRPQRKQQAIMPVFNGSTSLDCFLNKFKADVEYFD